MGFLKTAFHAATFGLFKSAPINIVMIGPPASGKGTQANILAKTYGLKKISTGDLLRAEIESKSDLGRAVTALVSSGGLVADEVVIGLISKRITQPDCANGVIFDGFPRTLAQAQALDAVLKAKGQKVTAAVELVVEQAELESRMQSRVDAALKAGQAVREDDKPKTLVKRLAKYNALTAAVTPFYHQKGVLFRTDGSASIENTATGLKAGIDSIIWRTKATRSAQPYIAVH